MFAGFTKIGNPSVSTRSLRDSADTWSSRSVMCRTWGIPACWKSDFDTPLSMATALASTPLPTYGRSSSSMRPCTVPSSPRGPCNNGITTMGCVVESEVMIDGVVATPLVSRRAGMVSGRTPPSGNSANVGACHDPSRAIAIGTVRYLVGSAARRTWAAVTQLTSCSADCPP